MAQSLHIGLQGPFTNLPFGICAIYFDHQVLYIVELPSFLGFKISLCWGSSFARDSLHWWRLFAGESRCFDLKLLWGRCKPIRVKYVSDGFFRKKELVICFFVSRKNESSMNHIVVLRSCSRVIISYLEIKIKAHISTRFPVFSILGGHHYWWSNLLWKNHCIAFFSHWSTFSGWGLFCPGSLQ